MCVKSQQRVLVADVFQIRSVAESLVDAHCGICRQIDNCHEENAGRHPYEMPIIELVNFS